MRLRERSSYAAAVAVLAAAVAGGCAAEPTDAPTRAQRPQASALPESLPASRGRMFVVAPSGSDGSPGTKARPWRTVQKALDTLRPGQIALVRSGTYAQNLVMQRAGTPTTPITVAAFPGERPVLRPVGATSMSYPLRITAGAAYVRFSGFVVEGAPLPTTVNVWVSDGQTEQPRAAHDIEISHCEIRNGRGSGLLVSPNTARVHLVANTVHDNGEGTEQHQGLYFQGQDGLIADNVVYHETGGFGIQVRGSPETGGSADRVLVVGNTAVDNYLSGIVVENSAANVTIANNISAFNGGWAVRGYDNGEGGVLPGNVAHDNLGYGNRSGEFGNSGRDVIEFGGNYGTEDPLFLDAARFDFRLQPASPAVDSGVPELSTTVDAHGVRRPRGTGPDLGAYER